MTQSHKASRLITKGQVCAVNFDSAYFPYDYDATGIQFGELIQPSGTSIYTIRDKNGVYGGGIAVEESTTNMTPYGDYSNYTTGYSPGWDTSLNGNLHSTNWSDYNSGVTSANVGYHAHINNTRFSYPVMEFIDKNSQYGQPHRWLGSSQQFTSNISANGWVDGTKVTVSMDIMVDGIDKAIVFGLYHLNSGSVSGFYDCETPSIYCTAPYQWQRVSQTFTININNGNWLPTSWATLYIYGHYCRNNYEGTAWVKNIQVETMGFGTSFIISSRSKGLLRYNDSLLDNNQGTISFWYVPDIAWDDSTTSNTSTNATTIEYLFTWGTPGQSNSLWAKRDRSAKQIVFTYNTTSNSAGYTLTGFAPAMITYSWSGVSQKLYINGSLVGTSSASAMSRPTTGFFDIGGRNEVAGYATCNGIIDDLRMDRQQVSDEEVLAWYTSGVPFYSPYDKRSFAY